MKYTRAKGVKNNARLGVKGNQQGIVQEIKIWS